MKNHSDLNELFQLFASIENKKEAEQLLRDILTPSEIEAVAERWQITKRLLDGEDSQRTIAEKTGAGVATVTRASKMIQYGSGGFRHFFKKMNNNG